MRKIVGQVLADNAPMLDFVRRLGFALRRSDRRGGVMVAERVVAVSALRRRGDRSLGAPRLRHQGAHPRRGIRALQRVPPSGLRDALVDGDGVVRADDAGHAAWPRTAPRRARRACR